MLIDFLRHVFFSLTVSKEDGSFGPDASLTTVKEGSEDLKSGLARLLRPSDSEPDSCELL